MPVYEFIDDSGTVHVVSMTFAEFDRRVQDDKIRLDDGTTAKTYWNSRGPSTVPANYPMVSSAAGVHPADIQRHMEHLRQKGCGQVDHTSDGDIIFRDKHQRKRVCEALGLFDRDGGYSDPAPRYRTANVRKMR